MIAKPQVSRSEWCWAIIWSIVVLILSCLPYLIAVQLAPAGWQFAGFLVNPLDGHSYLAKMRQGFDGSWLFHLTYTPEPHPGVFIFIFYLALGHLAALTRLPLIWTFHLARLLAGLLLLLAAFRFIGLVTPQLKERRLAFIFVLTASGFGWLGLIFGAFPIDMWVPEAFVPYSLYTNPHFPLGQALMLIIFQLVIWPESAKSTYELTNQQPRWLATILAGLSALTLALILPFALLTVWAVLFVFLGWLYLRQHRLPWLQIWPTLGVVLGGAPVLFYDFWISVTQPIIAGWSAQNITPAPSGLNLILGYGLIGILAVLGGWLVIRDDQLKNEQGVWLVVWWAFTTLVLVYLPLALQRRLINGLHLPLCLLAALGLRRWLDSSSLKAGYRRLITNAVVTAGALGTILVWTFPLLGFLSPPTESATTALFFWRGEEIAALNWLGQHTTADEVILASPRIGLFVPGQTGARAFYGHPFETIEADQKKAMVEAFYRGDIERVTPPADYIIYGPAEQALGQPAALPDFEEVYSVDHISIYRVPK